MPALCITCVTSIAKVKVYKNDKTRACAFRFALRGFWSNGALNEKDAY
jgi:hypothetical protein